MAKFTCSSITDNPPYESLFFDYLKGNNGLFCKLNIHSHIKKMPIDRVAIHFDIYPYKVRKSNLRLKKTSLSLYKGEMLFWSEVTITKNNFFDKSHVKKWLIIFDIFEEFFNILFKELDVNNYHYVHEQVELFNENFRLYKHNISSINYANPESNPSKKSFPILLLDYYVRMKNYFKDLNYNNKYNNKKK